MISSDTILSIPQSQLLGSRQETEHSTQYPHMYIYLNQCEPGSMTLYDVSWPQWVNTKEPLVLLQIS